MIDITSLTTATKGFISPTPIKQDKAHGDSLYIKKNTLKSKPTIYNKLFSSYETRYSKIY